MAETDETDADAITYQGLLEALEAHVGAFLGDFIVVAAATCLDRPGETDYHFFASPDTPSHRLRGLADMADGCAWEIDG